MWRDWKVGASPTATQAAIWNWMAQNFPANKVRPWWPGGGADSDVVAAAATSWLGQTIYADGYVGPIRLQQALADLGKGVENNVPTISATKLGTHAVLVKGTSWRKLSDAMQRPFAETVTVHDPGWKSNAAYPVGDFMNKEMPFYHGGCSVHPCAMNFQVAGQYNSGLVGFEDFNNAGGVYDGALPTNPTGRYRFDGSGNCYWDPTDSGPNQCNVSTPTGRFKFDGNGVCYWEPNDSGPDQCSPTSGRFKLDSGGNCYWDANDSGPDQCTPLLASRKNVGPVGMFAKTWRWVGNLLPDPSRSASLTSRSSIRLGGGVSIKRPSEPFLHSSSGKSKAEGSAQRERERARQDREAALPKVPHPQSTKPDEILKNIAAAMRESTFPDALGMDALRMLNGELKIARLLDVKSLSPDFGDDYYLVELSDKSGASYASVAITKAGRIRAVGDAREAGGPRALDLQTATAAVRNRIAVKVNGARYVYAYSAAQPGSPIFVPLVAVDTVRGSVYLNSHGGAFAEPGSLLEKDLASPSERPFADIPRFFQLQKLDRWD